MNRIIIIDDEIRLVRSLGRILEKEGHEVLCGERFAEVEEHLRPGEFDVLVSDILLPDMSGLQILREVKERGCQEPVILMTGEPKLETASEAVRLGAFDYLSKPVTKEDLLAVVSRACRHVTLLRERDQARSTELTMLRSLAAIGESAAVLAHEIRSPITAIHTALQVVAEKLDQDSKSVLEDLAASMERIQKLMERTLTFARPSEIRKSAIEATELLESSVSQLRRAQALESIDVQSAVDSDLPTFEGDLDRLQEVFVNLVQNAIEAMEGSGTVRICARRHGAEEIAFTVEDSGPGIPPSTRQSLFQPFVTSKQGGTGLGLAICRRIIELHRGTMEVGRSELGGARFTVRIPIEEGKVP